MEKMVLYGAGGLGALAFDRHKDKYDIICYVDSDPRKQGLTYKGLDIYAPEKLAELDFDYVMICCGTSTHHIAESLINEHNISPSKILRSFSDALDAAREMTLFLMAKTIYDNNVPGSVAELGVFEGKFAKEINGAFKDRRLYLFDTFDGFDERDLKVETENSFSSQPATYLKRTNEEKVLDIMPYPENCVIKKGYFPETAEGINDNFAYVNLDPDLYNPILEGLRFFYPRLEKGGFIMVHDYFNEFFKGVKQAVEDYEREMGVILPKTPVGDGMSIAIAKI